MLGLTHANRGKSPQRWQEAGRLPVGSWPRLQMVSGGTCATAPSAVGPPGSLPASFPQPPPPSPSPDSFFSPATALNLVLVLILHYPLLMGGGVMVPPPQHEKASTPLRVSPTPHRNANPLPLVGGGYFTRPTPVPASLLTSAFWNPVPPF